MTIWGGGRQALLLAGFKVTGTQRQETSEQGTVRV